MDLWKIIFMTLTKMVVGTSDAMNMADEEDTRCEINVLIHILCSLLETSKNIMQKNEKTSLHL